MSLTQNVIKVTPRYYRFPRYRVSEYVLWIWWMWCPTTKRRHKRQRMQERHCDAVKLIVSSAQRSNQLFTWAGRSCTVYQRSVSGVSV